MNEEHPKVFISYSQDGEEHEKWVLKLATDLRQHLGVDVIFDQWDLRIGDKLGLFMEQGLNNANLVLCVCSNQYNEKANSGSCGVGYETTILTGALLKDNNVNYIIPIIRNNSNKELPYFLQTRIYIDFSEDELYFENLRRLTDRIFDEDIVSKPPIGKNPYMDRIGKEVRVRTEIEKTRYHLPDDNGTALFDFKNNDGKFIIGSGEKEFCTKWTEAGADTIYACSDCVEKIGYKRGINEFPESNDFINFDFTSRVRQVAIGEVILWMNKYGKFAVTLITEISVRDRGAEEDKLRFEYKIYSLT